MQNTPTDKQYLLNKLTEIDEIRAGNKAVDDKKTQAPSAKEKTNSKDTKKKSKVFSTILKIFAVLLLILLVAGGGLYIYAGSVLKEIGLNVTPLETIQFILKGFNAEPSQDDVTGTETEKKKIPELKRDPTNKYTSILVVGIDTRPTSGKLMNTDSMMVITYNYEKSHVTMISIPRDLYINAPGLKGTTARINSMYSIAEKREAGTGLEYLVRSINSMTGIDIQYYAMINLAGFTKIVDTIGGIDVKIDKSFTDYRYPNPKTNVEDMVVKFVAGTEHMDGTRALIFARSRHSMDNLEGTDFARSRRQQKIMIAVKEKFLSSDVFLNPQKILELMDIVKENVRFSGFSIDDIEAGLNLVTKAKDSSIYSFVLDPTIANWSILTEHGIVKYGYGIGPKKPKLDYSDLKKYVSAIMEWPGMYKENAIVAVYDTGLGRDAAYSKMLSLQKTFPFIRFKFGGSLKIKTEGAVVFDQTKNTSKWTVNCIAATLVTENKTKPASGSSRSQNESVSVLLGKPKVVETATSTPQ